MTKAWQLTKALTPNLIKGRGRKVWASKVVAFNPSIAKISDKPFKIAFATRLRFDTQKRAPIGWAEGVNASGLVQMVLRGNKAFSTGVERVEFEGFPRGFRSKDREDPRLFMTAHGKLMLIVSCGKRTRRMFYKELDPNTMRSKHAWRFLCPKYKALVQMEKNWSPFNWRGKVYVVVRSKPFTVVDWSGNVVPTIPSSMAPINRALRTCEVRGSSPGVKTGRGTIMFVVHIAKPIRKQDTGLEAARVGGTASADGRVIGSVHRALKRISKKYFTAFLEITTGTNRFKVVGCTKFFVPRTRHTKDQRITFPTGLVLDDRDPKNVQWIVSFGEADVTSLTMKFNFKDVASKMRTPQQWTKIHRPIQTDLFGAHDPKAPHLIVGKTKHARVMKI